MSEWIPVAKAALRPKKGYVRLYSYAPSTTNRMVLQRQYMTDSHYGSRVCDFYMDIPVPTPPPVEMSE